jgi:hypothetical protein
MAFSPNVLEKIPLEQKPTMWGPDRLGITSQKIDILSLQKLLTYFINKYIFILE